MENREGQKQRRRTKNEKKQQRRREEYSLAAAASDSGDGLLQSKAGSESKLTDIQLKSVTQGFLELEIKGMAIVDKLPEDVLMDILSRMPAKSLLQWKSVSKHWYSLIRNPKFISLHHTRAKPGEILFLTRQVGDMIQIAWTLIASPTTFGNIDLSFIDRNVQLADSCNGVLCFQNASKIVICNPAIKEFRQLHLPFHQKERSSYLGFTFDPKANDYKAIKFVTRNCYPCDRLPYPRIGAAMEEHFNCPKTVCKCKKPVCFPNVYVYALSTDAWRQTDAVVPNYCIYHVPQCYRCTSSDGVFYWLAHDHAADAMHICVFRTSEELFESIPLPGIFRLKLLSNLCLLKDSLALALSDLHGLGSRRVDTCFDIWVMDEYGVQESWTKKYTTGPLLGCHDALGFRPNAEVLLTRHNYRQLVSYDLSAHNIVEYDPLVNTPEAQLVNEVLHYAESLISVKRLTSKKKKSTLKKKKKSISKKKNSISKC
ncbi:F-box protein CPR1-like [Rhododendron vialii]|uniref:F-box protein CPR1-like n=1 Tax=Rhododendron vialii TaxID=182163 RepID=UPI00265DC063|nr:F-box protein CPR1-like [Rhododendron vialii]